MSRYYRHIAKMLTKDLPLRESLVAYSWYWSTQIHLFSFFIPPFVSQIVLENFYLSSERKIISYFHPLKVFPAIYSVLINCLFFPLSHFFAFGLKNFFSITLYLNKMSLEMLMMFFPLFLPPPPLVSISSLNARGHEYDYPTYFYFPRRALLKIHHRILNISTPPLLFSLSFNFLPLRTVGHRTASLVIPFSFFCAYYFFLILITSHNK